MDWITAEHVAQFAALVIAIGAFWKNYSDGKHAAWKDQLAQAEERIATQNTRIDGLERKLDLEILYRTRLMDYIGELQRIMRQAGLQVPPMPDMEMRGRRTTDTITNE